MDSLASPLQVPKTRRKHSHAFKAMVVKACSEPGNSTSDVEQKYQLNANLIHKWRRDFERRPTEHFIPLPAPALLSPEELPDKTVRIVLPNSACSGEVTMAIWRRAVYTKVCDFRMG